MGASASQKQPAVATGGQQEACLASATTASQLLGGTGGCWGGSRALPLQVVCVFKMESAAPKAPAGEGEEAESNSVESLGFCNV